PRLGVQPAARVALPHLDQLLDELGIEEEVAQELAVRRAVAAEQAVQEPEVGRADSLETAIAVTEDLLRELPDSTPPRRGDEYVGDAPVGRLSARLAVAARGDAAVRSRLARGAAAPVLVAREEHVDVAEDAHVLDERVDEHPLEHV